MNQILTFIDTETTGLYEDKGDRIVEIGAIKMQNGIILEETFHFYLNPERSIPIESTRIHGITNEKVKNSPLFSSIATQLIEYVEGTILIAHNAPFDIKFLNMELGLLGMPCLTNDVQDTLKIARAKFPGSPASLDALCKRFNVNLKERVFHGALLDSKLLACVYRKMILNDQSDLNFSNKDIKKSNIIGERLPIKPIREDLCSVSKEEKESFKEYAEKYGFFAASNV